MAATSSDVILFMERRPRPRFWIRTARILPRLTRSLIRSARRLTPRSPKPAGHGNPSGPPKAILSADESNCIRRACAVKVEQYDPAAGLYEGCDRLGGCPRPTR